MMHLALAALASWTSDAQTIVRYSETLFCRRVLQRPDAKLVIAQIEVDAGHRQLKRTLEISNRSFSGRWTLAGSASARDTPGQIEPESIALPEGTAFPVTANLLFDGKVVWRAERRRPNEEIMVIPAQRGAQPPRFQPGVTFLIDGAELPSLFGIQRAELVIKSATGEQVVSRPFSLPDWASLEAELASAYEALEDERRRGQCRPNASVTVAD